MPKLNFFRQARVDGGIRTGIDADGTSVEYFENGTDDDPALSWFVDLRFEGNDVPANPAQAREWLLENKVLVEQGYHVLRDKLAVGSDPDAMPVRCDVPGAPPGLTATAVCSSTGTVSARQIGATVQDIAEHWEEYLHRLRQMETPLA